MNPIDFYNQNIKSKCKEDSYYVLKALKKLKNADPQFLRKLKEEQRRNLK